jgi:hypothetical protein
MVFASPAARGKLPDGLMGALFAVQKQVKSSPIRLRHLPPRSGGREHLVQRHHHGLALRARRIPLIAMSAL